MRMALFSTVILILAVFSSCGNCKKKKKEKEASAVEATNKYTTENGSTVWVMLYDMNVKPESDPFTLIDVHVDEMNMLHLTVEYGGGCKPHEFKILGSMAILKSMPAQRPVMIVHNANEDNCRAIIREEILVDISDFAYTKENGSEIILLIDGQRLSYIYQDPAESDK